MTRSITLFFLLATACLADDSARVPQEDAIRESVFRYQFDHNTSKLAKTAKAYYLTMGEKLWDPPDEFMKRFTGHTPPVRKFSEWHKGSDGLSFRISNMRWVSDTEVRVAGGCSDEVGTGSCNTYTVKKGAEGWKVVTDKKEDCNTWMPYGPGKP